MRGYFLAGALAAVMASALAGYLKGYAAAEADFNAERLAQIEAGQMLDAARIEALKSRDALLRKLEEQANAETIADDQCFSPSRVRRLNSLR